MFHLDLKYTGFPPLKRQYNNAVKEVLRETAAQWHERFFEGHFTVAGAQRYGYYARKGELQRGSKRFKRTYVGRKERVMGHSRPLYYTGEAYRDSKFTRVVATNKEARVILSRKFNLKHPKSRIRMRDEVTRVLPAEQTELMQFAQSRIASRINQFRETTTTQI